MRDVVGTLHGVIQVSRLVAGGGRCRVSRGEGGGLIGTLHGVIQVREAGGQEKQVWGEGCGGVQFSQGGKVGGCRVCACCCYLLLLPPAPLPPVHAPSSYTGTPFSTPHTLPPFSTTTWLNTPHNHVPPPPLWLQVQMARGALLAQVRSGLAEQEAGGAARRGGWGERQ